MVTESTEQQSNQESGAKVSADVITQFLALAWGAGQLTREELEFITRESSFTIDMCQRVKQTLTVRYHPVTDLFARIAKGVCVRRAPQDHNCDQCHSSDIPAFELLTSNVECPGTELWGWIYHLDNEWTHVPGEGTWVRRASGGIEVRTLKNYETITRLEE